MTKESYWDNMLKEHSTDVGRMLKLYFMGVMPLSSILGEIRKCMGDAALVVQQNRDVDMQKVKALIANFNIKIPEGFENWRRK